MRIETAVACVGYDDFLRATLAAAMRIADRVTVLTAPWDRETPEVAAEFGASLLVTNAWRVNGSFNKARALNEWIDGLSGASEDTWLMTLDADIHVPPDFAVPRTGLDAACLYGVRRRMCPSETDWQAYVERQRTLESFRVEVLPIVAGKLWGTLHTRHDAGLLGFLQLWNPAGASGWRRFRETPTASGYDVLFGLSYPEDARRFLSGEVLHLGPARVNWSGRRSERWGFPAECAGA